MFCSDSLTLIEAINGSSHASSQIRSIVQEIKNYVQDFDTWDYVWIARESNHLVDHLVRLGRNGGSSDLCILEAEDLSFFVFETHGETMKR